VTEPCNTPGCPLGIHNASIAGHRSGSAVSFVKRYEPPSYGYDTVFYEGVVNAEATEIDGRWKLPGTLFSGTFLMVRSTKPAEAVARADQRAGAVAGGRDTRSDSRASPCSMNEDHARRAVTKAATLDDPDSVDNPITTYYPALKAILD
jgi:hypothetical protein